MPQVRNAEALAKLLHTHAHKVRGRVVHIDGSNNTGVARWMAMAQEASANALAEEQEFDVDLQMKPNPLPAKLKKAAKKAEQKERFA